MAKGIEMNGQLRGKRGGNVYYRAMGDQVSRALNKYPNNPKTIGQAKQRMVFGTVASARGGLAPIVDHSFEGVAFGTPSLSEFQRRNVKLLQATLKDAQNDTAGFAIYGAGAVVPNAYMISKGSLGIVSFSPYADNNTDMAGVIVPSIELSDFSRVPGNSAGYEEALALLGLVPGDQLSLILISEDDSIEVASYKDGDAKNLASHCEFCRVVFKKSEDITAFTQPLIDEAGLFDSAYVVREVGELYVKEDAENKILFISPYSGSMARATTLIRSQKQEDGSWKRSTAFLGLIGKSTALANDVYPSYMAQAGEDNTSKRFLNNAFTVNPT